MSTLIVPLAFPGPYTVDGIGVVRAADGTVIGAAASRYMGLQPHTAMTARLFATAPLHADAAARLSLAAGDLLAARTPGEHDTAAAAVARAQSLAWEAIAGLRDPNLRPEAALNGHITELLNHLPRGAALQVVGGAA